MNQIILCFFCLASVMNCASGFPINETTKNPETSTTRTPLYEATKTPETSTTRTPLYEATKTPETSTTRTPLYEATKTPETSTTQSSNLSIYIGAPVGGVSGLGTIFVAIWLFKRCC